MTAMLGSQVGLDNHEAEEDGEDDQGQDQVEYNAEIRHHTCPEA